MIMKRAWILLLLSVNPGYAQEPAAPIEGQATLPTVVIDDVSSSEALSLDPFIPRTRVELSPGTGNGSLNRRLLDALPFSGADQGTPGAMTQFRGVGRSTEDTNVQTLGVPLNPAQGGGFDLSSFPAYLWSSARFQLGLPQGAYDLRASSGTLTLVPWTEHALQDSDANQNVRAVRLTQNFARRLSQTSVGAHTLNARHAPLQAAANLGYSQGVVEGPSGSLSARLRANPSSMIQAHVLATDLKAETPGPARYPTPDAFQRTKRIIPVLQSEWKLASKSHFRLSSFYDSGRLENFDPRSAYESWQASKQWGVEAAQTLDALRIGATFRRAHYESWSNDGNAFRSPGESQSHASIARTLIWDEHWSGEPFLQGDWVESLGFYPGGGVAIRYDFDRPLALYARASSTPRFPTLIDRYFTYAPMFGFKGFKGNAQLNPERNLSVLFGSEARAGALELRTEFFYQRKDDLQIRSPLESDLSYDTMLNQGRGNLFVLTQMSDWKATPWLTPYLRATYARSEILETGAPFPFQPEWIGILGVDLHSERGAFSVKLWNRAQSSVSSDLSGSVRLPGFSLWSAELALDVGSSFEFSFRAENLADRKAELSSGFPLPGRVFALFVSGSF